MAQATPTRRSSYAPSTVSELTSPPPSFSRRESTVSSVGLGSPSVGSSAAPAHAERKRRNRTLLRDYYGLGAGKGGSEQLDIDSPSTFNADAYFAHLTSTASLPDLLKRENELLNEIRELDGERQSLVYNHHSELIDASDTIRKMKSRAEALDTSLDALKSSFQSISQLSTSLASTTSHASTSSASPHLPSAPYSPTNPPETPSRRRLSTLSEGPDSPSTPTISRPRAASTAAPPAPPTAAFDPLVHLPALLSLPILLRAFLSTDERGKADSLWGTWEPALRSWEDEGIDGVREVGQECREVLRMARRASVSERREGL
ncbi:hypothetical protein JCM6882_002882 [Rhodosporidiobolus microsporus]